MRFEYLFFAVFALVVISTLYRVLKHGGLRGAAFGAPIARTIGEMDLGQRGMVRMRLKVHTFEAGASGSPDVGVEVVTTTVGSWHMMPLPLSQSEARNLSGLLSQAADEAAVRRG